MVYMTPKLDWTASDFINFADFNRIENNIQEVANYLNSIQYSIPSITSVISRSNTSIDYLSSINRIEQNLETIRKNSLTLVDYLPSKVWSLGMGFDYNDANRLEINTKLLYDFGQLAFQNFKYCGTITCGEEGLIY